LHLSGHMEICLYTIQMGYRGTKEHSIKTSNLDYQNKDRLALILCIQDNETFNWVDVGRWLDIADLIYSHLEYMQ